MARALFTPEQKEYFLSINEGRFAADIAELINKRFNSNITTVQIRNWRKDNKMPGHVSRKGIRVNPATEFKKGAIAHNRKPVGTIVKRNYDGYLQIKVSEAPPKWVLLQRHVWEEEHGPIPKGCKVVFLNGNREDVRLDNLILAKCGELSVMNAETARWHWPAIATPELTKTKLAVAKVKMALTRRKRGK